MLSSTDLTPAASRRPSGPSRSSVAKMWPLAVLHSTSPVIGHAATELMLCGITGSILGRDASNASHTSAKLVALESFVPLSVAFVPLGRWGANAIAAEWAACHTAYDALKSVSKVRDASSTTSGDCKAPPSADQRHRTSLCSSQSSNAYGVDGYSATPPSSERDSAAGENSMKIGPPRPACEADWYHSLDGVSAVGVKMKKPYSAAGWVPTTSLSCRCPGPVLEVESSSGWAGCTLIIWNVCGTRRVSCSGIPGTAPLPLSTE